MKKNKLAISVFFPCFNDQKSIKKLVADAFLVLDKLAYKYEVIVIDDGSSDNSRKVLAGLKKEYPNLKMIFHDRNIGYGGALKSGFRRAQYEWIFYTDGDGQYDIGELPLLVQLASSDVDFVNGIKMSRNDPTYRIFIGNLYSFVVRWLFWLPVYDVDCDFRLIRKKIIDKIKLESNNGSICVELVKKAQRAGATFRQVSVHHYERHFGNSQFFRADRIIITLWELAKNWIKLMLLDNIFKFT